MLARRGVSLLRSLLLASTIPFNEENPLDELAAFETRHQNNNAAQCSPRPPKQVRQRLLGREVLDGMGDRVGKRLLRGALLDHGEDGQELAPLGEAALDEGEVVEHVVVLAHLELGAEEVLRVAPLAVLPQRARAALAVRGDPE